MTELSEIYAALPSIDCKLRCQPTCNAIDLLEVEKQRLGDLGSGVCPKLNGLGLCSVHEDRPLVCRLYGVVENMRCPFGCQPTRMLSVAEGREIVAAAERVAGPWLES